MTKLKDMKDAPKDASDILALYNKEKNKYWIIVHYYESSGDFDNFCEYLWHNEHKDYSEEEFSGWLPLPPIQED